MSRYFSRTQTSPNSPPLSAIMNRGSISQTRWKTLRGKLFKRWTISLEFLGEPMQIYQDQYYARARLRRVSMASRCPFLADRLLKGRNFRIPLSEVEFTVIKVFTRLRSEETCGCEPSYRPKARWTAGFEPDEIYSPTCIPETYSSLAQHTSCIGTRLGAEERIAIHLLADMDATWNTRLLRTTLPQHTKHGRLWD